MQTISFYSYKGGVGRSLVLANIAYFLAGFGKKVFVMDLDLEAPGLHYKFDLQGGRESIEKGVLDFLHSAQDDPHFAKSAKLKEYVRPVEKRYGDGEIYLMATGKALALEYSEKLGQIRWNSLCDSQNANVFDALKKLIRETYQPDFLLIDSRTGITYVGHFAVQRLADRLVCLLMSNEENYEGAATVMLSTQIYKENIEIIPVISRLPNTVEGEKQVKDLKDRLKSDGLPEPEILHTESILEVRETLRIGGERSAAVSILLRDYLRLCLRLFPNEEIVPSSCKIALDKLAQNPEEKVSEMEFIGDRIERRKNKGQPWIGVAKGKYIKGENYISFVKNLIVNVMKLHTKKLHTKSRDIPDIPSENLNWDVLTKQRIVNEIPFEKLKWDVLTTQIRDGVFDFCGDPYFVTQSRRHLLGFLQFGRLESYTAYVRENSNIYNELHSDAINLDWKLEDVLRFLIVDKKVFGDRITEGKEQTAIAGWADTAATSECQKALANIQSGAFPATESTVERLVEWIEARENNNEEWMIICDHGLVRMLDDELKKNNLNLKCAANTPELTFPFDPPLPVGFAYPIEDEEWGKDLAHAMSKMITDGHDHHLGYGNRQESQLAKVDSDAKEGAGRNDDQGLTDENKTLTEEAWEKVKQDLKEVEIEAFTFPELCLSLMRSMKYDEAHEWYSKLPKKLQSEISKQ